MQQQPTLWTHSFRIQSARPQTNQEHRLVQLAHGPWATLKASLSLHVGNEAMTETVVLRIVQHWASANGMHSFEPHNIAASLSPEAAAVPRRHRNEFLFLMQSPNMLTCIHSVMPTALLSSQHPALKAVCSAAALCRITHTVDSFIQKCKNRIQSASCCLEPWTIHEPGASVGLVQQPAAAHGPWE